MTKIKIGPNHFLIVDDQFAAEIGRHTWRPFRRGSRTYAKRSYRIGKRIRSEYAHRRVLRLAGLPVPKRTRIVDGNGLNITIENLAIA